MDATALFVGATVLVAYTYLGYPLLLWLFTFWKRWPAYSDPKIWPSASLLISVYNEEEVIRQKLENAIDLNYPGTLEIITISDCSDDGTDAIVAEFADCGVVLERLSERSGKTAGQNAGVRRATGDVVVFSDANSLYDRGALEELLRPFADTEMGCVCGELRYRNPNSGGAGQGEGLYWRYEQLLKRRESQLGSLVGANGSIYALRRSLFEELGDAVISDFIMPIRVRRAGYRVVYAPEAIAREYSAKGFGAELRRRTRIIARSIYGLWTERGILNPFTYGLFSLQVLSHKLIRWIVPILLIVAFTTNALLMGAEPYRTLFALQIVFYLCASLGAVAPSWLGRMSLFYVPAYFCAINLGALFGMAQFLMGRRYTVWQTAQRQV